MAKVFSKSIMVSENVQAHVLSCKVYDEDGAAIEIFDGAFLELGDLAEDTTYVATGDKDENVYKATYAASDAAHPVVIDIPEISNGVIAGNNYKIGIKLFDLVMEAGKPVRCRRLCFGDKFWLGEDNFAAAVADNKGATIDDGTGLLAPVATAPTSGFGIKIQKSKDFNYGTKASGKLYLCEVVSL